MSLSYKNVWRVFILNDGTFELNYFSGKTRFKNQSLMVVGYSLKDKYETNWNNNWFTTPIREGYIGTAKLLNILYGVEEIEYENII